MLDLTINGERRTLSNSLTVTELLQQFGYDPTRVAVEINENLIPRPELSLHRLSAGDVVEIVTLVGGGSQADEPPSTSRWLSANSPFTAGSSPAPASTPATS